MASLLVGCIWNTYDTGMIFEFFEYQYQFHAERNLIINRKWKVIEKPTSSHFMLINKEDENIRSQTIFLDI